MSAALQLVDQTPSGRDIRRTTLRLVRSQVTLREIIAARVRSEVDAFNSKPESKRFEGLVQPTDTERVLNGYGFRKRRTVDAEVQVEKALEAFERNGFFVLVADRQVDSLDEMIDAQGQDVIFVKLLPLVGG